MGKTEKIATIEILALVLIWSIVIITPLLFIDDFDKDKTGVQIMWIEYTIIGVVFLLNRTVLMPRLFFMKRYVWYIISLVLLFSILSILIIYFDIVHSILSMFDIETLKHTLEPTKDLPFNHMPHQGGGAPHGAMPQGGMPHGSMPQGGANTHNMPLPHIGSPEIGVNIIPPYISVIILSAIVIALDMGLSIAMRWVKSEQKQAEINKERMAAQLSNLQSQVSPHFLMNTLNNIHALVDIDSERAKQTIIELSGLMDYLLYDSSSRERISLQRELDFLSSYINLMRLRFPKQVAIRFSYNDNIPSVKIPPLLFLNFIENAFKYGVDYDKDSYINIRFNFSETTIELDILNSNHSSSIKSSRHGFGIKNSKKRLDLLYGNSYTLDIEDDDNKYYVNLKIPVL